MNVTGLIALRVAALSHWHLPAAWLRPLRLQRRQTVREARVAFMQERAHTAATWRELAKAAKRAGLYAQTSYDGDVAGSLMGAIGCIDCYPTHAHLDTDHRLTQRDGTRDGHHPGGTQA